ncbi:sensor histidine kinase [Flavitalea sp.]|nr:sensor histidine kinase [Flavitalea sp.]
MKGTGFYIPFRLADEAISRQEEKNIYLFYAFFSGWLSFVVLFGLLTLVLTRERVYLWYSLYVLSYCLFFIADGDLDFEWFYPHWPALATITPIVYGLMINFFMLLFMGNFLFLKKSHPRIFMISKIWLGIILIELALIIVGFNYSDNISLRTFVYYFGLITVLGSWLLQITGILRRISDGYRPAYLYGIALLSVFASAILYIIHALGVGSSLIPSYLYVPIGFALEIVILAFALIYSSNFYKNKHQELTLRIATQQRDFSNQLLSVQESEQKRIAHDLHDEVGSMIAAIKITLGTLPLTADKRPVVLQMMDRLSLSTRNIAHNLMPPEFESTKLTQLLSSFYDHLNSQNNLKFNFYVSGKSEYFNKHDELVIYRIIMEITNNIIRHAEAKEATIQLIYSEFNLQIIAEDDGKGFDPGTLGGFGLRSIQSRVNFMQGTINIDSGQYGTSIVITLPFIKSE